jgi:kinetochore protein Spc7/SPC105
MRDIKTHARYRSKEMWYGWRSQLLEDLMKALQSIGEGLIRDDEKLQHAEQILEQIMPGLLEQHQSLQAEAQGLEDEAAAVNEDEREELETAREKIQATAYEIREKQKILADLQKDMQEQETQINDLEESRAEFAAAIKEADRVKESCRSISTNEITALKGMFKTLYIVERPFC